MCRRERKYLVEAGVLLQESDQRAVLAVLQDEHLGRAGRTHADERDDVGVLRLRHERGLLHERGDLVERQVALEHLESDGKLGHARDRLFVDQALEDGRKGALVNRLRCFDLAAADLARSSAAAATLGAPAAACLLGAGFSASPRLSGARLVVPRSALCHRQ